MGELHTGSRHPQNCTDPESCFKLQVVPPGYQQKGEGNCEYVAQYDQAYYGWMGLVVGLGHMLTYERETPIISPQTGEAFQPWLATHLGDEN